MAILIIIVIICIMIHLGNKGKVYREEKKRTKHPAEHLTSSRTKRGMSQKETDELITVILPTVNNDK